MQHEQLTDAGNGSRLQNTIIKRKRKEARKRKSVGGIREDTCGLHIQRNSQNYIIISQHNGRDIEAESEQKAVNTSTTITKMAVTTILFHQ